jgi:hypothetical protein
MPAEHEWTPEALEQAFMAALGKGDVKGVESALTVMCSIEPRRAIQLWDELRDALAVARFIRGERADAG